MLLKKIKLENIRSYINEEIEFPQGSILLSGNIGSGKSTILQAVDFALFGITQELSGSSLLRNGEDRGSVELHFAVEDKNVIIKRNLKRGTSVTQDAGYISINNAHREATATELKQSILTLLNYPEELLTKSKSLIYRYTVYTPQEEMKTILQGDKDYRLDTLRRVFGIDKYKRLKENAEVVMSYIKGKNKENAIMIADLEQKKSEKEKHKLQAKTIRGIIESLLPKLNEYHFLLEEKKKKVEVLEKEIKEQNEKRKLKEVTENSLKHKGEEYARNILQIQEIEAVIRAMELEIAKEAPPIANREIVLAKEKEIMLGETQVRTILNSMQERKTSKVHAERIIADITKLENCPICKQKVTKEHQEQVTKEERSKITVQDQEIEVFQKQAQEKEAILKMQKQEIEQLRKAIEDLQEHKKKVEIEKATNEREIDHLDKQINVLEADIQKKEKIRNNIGYLKEVQFWLENMFINLMTTMEKKIMLKVHADFSTFFRKWFEILVDTEAIKVALDDEFCPLIEQNGHEINYNFLSGGEKTAAALAYRLALNQVINSIMSVIRTKELIILDEPTDGFSAEQIDRLRIVLEELKTKQIIIVSHENKIESFVQHVIKIEKKDHISAIATQ